MPTLEHEYLLDLVRKRPSLAADLLAEAGKRWSWPVYLATLRARLKCPGLLLVFCEDEATARQCGEPIDMGHPGWVLQPVVAGPVEIPLITDRAWAMNQPDLALVSAVTHARADDGLKVAQTLVEAAEERPEELREYVYLMLLILPDDALAKLKETLMTMVIEPRNQFMRDVIARWRAEGRAEGKAEGRAEGEAEGEAKSILLVLEARGIPVPDEAKTRITECTDLDILESWVRKAATAGSVDELFD